MKINNRYDNSKIINEQYIDYFCWDFEWDYIEDFEWEYYDVEYQYLSKEEEDKILSNNPFCNPKHLYRSSWLGTYKTGSFIDMNSIYPTEVKRDKLLEALFAPDKIKDVKDPIISEYCENWKLIKNILDNQ
jgi:hypothetical protein